MKLLLSFGTRPEAIKMAPIVRELKKRNLEFKICVTAQHREMLDQVLDFFEIIPDYDLDIMMSGQTLNSLSATIFGKIDKIFDIVQPDMVLVHGDTTTACIVAQGAFNRQIKVGHIEAGLRTFNKKSPFPEELNRQIISKIADFHFTPTEKANANLLQEGIPAEQLILTGNTVVDALHWALEKLTMKELNQEIKELKALLNNNKKLILVTGHRRENFGKSLQEIGEALLELSLLPNIEIIYPVHLNPNVKNPVQNLLGNCSRIYLIPPVSYPTMLWLMQKADLIISDSGGIQEEAPVFGKPVLVTREFSERMEGVEAGFSILVGSNKQQIINESIRLIENPPELSNKKNPFGDGKAAEKIVAFLENPF